MLPALAAFIGFDSAASLGVEARRPFASIPRAITATAAVAAVLYLVATLVQLATPGGAGRATSPTSGVPATVGDLSWASILMDVGIVASFGACALAALNTLVRVLFSLAREGVAPAALGRTHRRYLHPGRRRGVTVPVPAAVVVVGAAAGVAPATVFGGLVAVATLGFLAAYLLVCLAAPRFLARIGELTGGVVVVSVLASAALVATVVVVVLHASTGLLITLAGLARRRRRRVGGPAAAPRACAAGDGRVRRDHHRRRPRRGTPVTSPISGRQPQAVRSALLILEEVAAAGVGVTAKEISAALRIPPATTYRLLNLLVAEEYLVRLPDLGGLRARAGASRTSRPRPCPHRPRRAP